MRLQDQRRLESFVPILEHDNLKFLIALGRDKRGGKARVGVIMIETILLPICSAMTC